MRFKGERKPGVESERGRQSSSPREPPFTYGQVFNQPEPAFTL